MDASDRSLQIELSVDVLRELNHSVPDENFSAVSAQLEWGNRNQTVSGDLPVKNGSHFRNRHITSNRNCAISSSPTKRSQRSQMQETSVHVTDGKEAKEKIAVLINELVKIVEGKVAEFNITDAIPAFITNVDRRWRTSEIGE
jgi:hypothetical protein